MAHIRIASFNNGAAEASVEIHDITHEVLTLQAVVQSGTLVISMRKNNGAEHAVNWGAGEWNTNDVPSNVIAEFDEEVQEYGLPASLSYTAQWIPDPS